MTTVPLPLLSPGVFLAPSPWTPIYRLECMSVPPVGIVFTMGLRMSLSKRGILISQDLEKSGREDVSRHAYRRKVV